MNGKVLAETMHTFLLYTSLLVISACALTEHPSLARFITFVHTEKDPELRIQAWEKDYWRKFLINRIDADQWHIVYDVPKKCSSRKTKDQLQKAMRQAIRQWLQPLIGLSQSPLVDTFVFTELPTYDNPENDEDERIFSTTDIEVLQPHLQVVFYCRDGRSYAYPWLQEIHMYTKSKQPKALKISNTNYSIPTLMHEIGHAFGLADTYAEAYDDDDQKEDAADDHHDATDRAEIGNELGIVKNQPFSVMAGNMYLDDSNQSMLLFKDDIAGIRWLYRYFHFKNTDTETCHHPDYEFEMIDRQEQISGCRPRHPLIFETKQKHISSSVYLIRHVSDIDINAHDSHGNTALHYASRYGLCDVVRALLARPDIHKDKPNADGITPLVYAEQAGHARTAALLRGGKGARCRAKPKTSACASIGEEVSNANSAGRAGLLLVILLFPVLLCSVGRFTCPRAKSDWRDA